MPRLLLLTDEHWSKLQSIMLDHGIYDKPNLRKTVACSFIKLDELILSG